jgi:hypothetical protein
LSFLRLVCRLAGLTQCPLGIAQLLGNFLLALIGVVVSLRLELSACSTFRSRSQLKSIAGSLEAIGGSVRAQLIRRCSQLICSVWILLAVVVGHLLQLLLNRARLRRQVLLLFAELSCLLLRLGTRLQLLDLLLLLSLLASQLLNLLLSLSKTLLQILRIAALSVLPEDSLGLIDGVHRLLLRLLLLLGVSGLLRLAHIVDRLLKLLSRLSGLRIVLLAR